jgi:hypothetical protein
MFLGTPHRGADLSSILSSLLSVSFSRKVFVNQLQVGGDLIQGINDDFSRRAHSLRLVSFYESTGVRGFGVHSSPDRINCADDCSQRFCNLGFPDRETSPIEWKPYGNLQVPFRGGS